MIKDVRDFKNLEGMLYEDAQLIIEKPYFLTPIYYNGVRCKQTEDINPNRVNVIIENNRIVSVISIL